MLLVCFDFYVKLQRRTSKVHSTKTGDCYTQNMQLDYLEMQGTGNRILVVDQRVGNLQPPDAKTVQRLGSAEIGPGFDQMMWLGPASDPDNAASYRVFNADGSEVEQCGNGVRCVARALTRKSEENPRLTLESPAGLVRAMILESGLVSISMGTPEFAPERIPFIASAEAPQYPLDVNGTTIEVAALSMGNPHCVLQVPDVATAPVAIVGPVIEHHDRFPQRANVGFMHVVNRTTIDLRVHERGVGETQACGTGACAAMVAGHRLGLLDADITVRLPGGQVVVSWRGGKEPVWLTGNAELISEGTVEL
jgi:diaminopimelate epimerase